MGWNPFKEIERGWKNIVRKPAKQLYSAHKKIGQWVLDDVVLLGQREGLKDALGLNLGKDMAAMQEAQLEQMRQQNLLDASQEVQNVLQFDNQYGGVSANSALTRRNRRPVGAYSSSLGLQV